MKRYQGIGKKMPSRICAMTNLHCEDSSAERLMIFDGTSAIPLVDRPFTESARVAISPDGTRYATFESGELRIYSFPKSGQK
jgi:hypothetical protein